MDMEANGLLHKQFVEEASKKEFELPNEEYDEVRYTLTVTQDVD